MNLKFFTGLVLVLSARAEKLPVFEGASGTWFTQPNVFTVPEEGLILSDDTVLQADRVVLKGGIVTQGKALKILARVLTVENNSCIRSFAGPAAATAVVGPGRAQAGSGDGGPGNSGPDNAAVPGSPVNQDILVFADQVEGRLCVDGSGQEGGKGAKGGPGQKGARGSDGRKASCHPFGISSGSATPGGQGSKGGPGGRGGRGGPGGPAAALHVFFNSSTEAPNSFVLTANPGRGGVGGDPGDVGPGGEGGRGGDGDSSLFCSKDGAPNGPNGPSGDSNLGSGPVGAAGPAAPVPQSLKLEAMARERLGVKNKWFEFHWDRLFQILSIDSFRLVLSEEATREDVAQDQNFAAEYQRVQSEYLADVVKSWKLYFLKALDESEQAGRMNASNAQALRSLGQGVVSALESLRSQATLEDSKKSFTDLQTLAKACSEKSLKASIEGCTLYNESLANDLQGTLNNYYLTYRDRYRIPVCEKDPDLSRPENFLANIKVERPLEALIAPEGLKSFLQVPASDGQASLGSLLRRLFFGAEALADDPRFDIVVMKYLPFDPAVARGARPQDRPLTSYGMPDAYVVPATKQITRESLKAQLKSLVLERERL